MSRPLEYEYISHVAYCRALEEYTDELEAVLLECRGELHRVNQIMLREAGIGVINLNVIAKIDEVIK